MAFRKARSRNKSQACEAQPPRAFDDFLLAYNLRLHLYHFVDEIPGRSYCLYLASPHGGRAFHVARAARQRRRQLGRATRFPHARRFTLASQRV